MRSEMATEREESSEELALRATLHAHADAAVDTDAVWKAVAPRLGVARGSGRALRLRRAGPLTHVSRGVLIAAAVVALVVALTGAGVAYWSGVFDSPEAHLIGDRSLWTTVGHRQTVNGITVSIDK